jgi:hypothetical protein
LSILRRYLSYAEADDQARKRDHPRAGTNSAHQ